MNLKTISIIALLILLSIGSVSVKADEDFDKAILKSKKALTEAMNISDEAKLIKARGQFERILQLKQQPWLVNYYMALADYGLALVGMRTEDKDKTKKYTESGIETINKSIDENPEFCDSFVLLESLNFNRWQYEQEKMEEIISATQYADTEAKKLDANNPRYVLVTGISQFYMPEAFGGGVKIALPTLEKSEELFKTYKPKSELYPDWGQDMSYGYIALCLLKRDDEGDKAKAKEMIDEGLKINPDSGFLTGYVMKEYNAGTEDKK
ncbi:MAG TPA: hypothetical protein PK294_06440 [Ignavibacteria bacterium]|nr:hypothetical protein [Ignavibacteria bacterium]HQY52446.1 hypothetical protein [Ignavibacteria bacterium]HRB00056.1 hypothetical protein [Ignavibacteria bacterium]